MTVPSSCFLCGELIADEVERAEVFVDCRFDVIVVDDPERAILAATSSTEVKRRIMVVHRYSCLLKLWEGVNDARTVPVPTRALCPPSPAVKGRH